jgi:hypothetical protein
VRNETNKTYGISNTAAFNFYGNYYVGNSFEQHNSILFAGSGSKYCVYSNAAKYAPFYQGE